MSQLRPPITFFEAEAPLLKYPRIESSPRLVCDFSGVTYIFSGEGHLSSGLAISFSLAISPFSGVAQMPSIEGVESYSSSFTSFSVELKIQKDCLEDSLFVFSRQKLKFFSWLRGLLDRSLGGYFAIFFLADSPNDPALSILFIDSYLSGEKLCLGFLELGVPFSGDDLFSLQEILSAFFILETSFTATPISAPDLYSFLYSFLSTSIMSVTSFCSISRNSRTHRIEFGFKSSL